MRRPLRLLLACLVAFESRKDKKRVLVINWMSAYVVITPAHNEERFLEKTIASMRKQTVKPLRWVIVNDASTDRTGAIVVAWKKRCDFIQLVDLERDSGRTFARKATAFERGFAEVRQLGFDFVGNLDADISFGPRYF